MSALSCSNSSSSTRDVDRTKPQGDVILVSRSTELAADLSNLGVHVVLNITDIPEALRLRCIIFDPEFAQVSDLSWIRRAYPTGDLTFLHNINVLDMLSSPHTNIFPDHFHSIHCYFGSFRLGKSSHEIELFFSGCKYGRT